MNIANNRCQYPGAEHLLADTSMSAGSVIYGDDQYGIPEMIRICDEHYKYHILKYWPESRLATYFRKRENPLAKVGTSI